MRGNPHGEAPAEAPPTWVLCAGLVGRLRSLAKLDAKGGGSGGRWYNTLCVADCDELAAALERLPNPAALTFLELGQIDLDASRQLPACGAQRSLAVVRRLAAALRRCQALRSLRFHVTSESDAMVAAAAEALLRAARELPALTDLSACCRNDSTYGSPYDNPPIFEVLPLKQLEALDLRFGMSALFAPLLRAGAAGALASLRSLRVDFDRCGVQPSKAALRALWRAPWLAQLTRLELAVDNGDLAAADGLFAALPDPEEGRRRRPLAPPTPPPPPPLRSIRELVISSTAVDDDEPDDGSVAPDGLRRLLAAVNPATLEALAIHDCQAGAAAVLTERVGALTSLKRLTLNGRDFCRSVFELDGRTSISTLCDRPAAPWRAIQEAPFPPSLESLDAVCGGWLLWRPERLEALLSAPWAVQLVELRVTGGDGAVDGRERDVHLDMRALAALSAALPSLQRLELHDLGIEAGALENAAARGDCAGLAARLVELTIIESDLETGSLAAIGRIPFERLERLRVDMPNKALAMVDLEALGAAGAPWLARLAKLELDAAPHKTRAEVWAAALDPDGPLRALHRGGGEVVVLNQCWS